MTNSVEKNKALVRRFQEEAWRGNVAIINELAAPNILLGGASREQWKAGVLDTLKRTPDMTFKIEEMIAEGDKVCFRWTMQGTHTNELSSPYGPAAPTGKVITITGINIHRVEDGKIVEDRFETNAFSFFQQLGAIPTPGQNT